MSDFAFANPLLQRLLTLAAQSTPDATPDELLRSAVDRVADVAAARTGRVKSWSMAISLQRTINKYPAESHQLAQSVIEARQGAS